MALYREKIVSKSLRYMARVNEGPHTFIHKWNEPYLPLLIFRPPEGRKG